MGAVLNLRPDLCAAAVAEVPFVDVVNTMSDPTIPLTVIEYDEWGDPADPAFHEVMRSYSPYDNVQAADYPAMYVTAGLNDPRVQYWEPAKWVAKLRTTVTGGGPILLRTELGAGHGGRSGRYDAWRDEARVLAFVLDRVAWGATRDRSDRDGGPSRHEDRGGCGEGATVGRPDGRGRQADGGPGEGGAVLVAAAAAGRRVRPRSCSPAPVRSGWRRCREGRRGSPSWSGRTPRSRPCDATSSGRPARGHVVTGDTAALLRGERAAGRAVRPGAPRPPYRLPKAELASLLLPIVVCPRPRATVVVERAARDGVTTVARRPQVGRSTPLR
jgi:hypothetical protein